MIESRNPLLIALVVLQVATLCFMTLLFFNSPSHQGSTERALVSDHNRPVGGDPATPDMLEMELRAIRAEIAALRAAAGAPVPAIAEAPRLSEQELQAQAQALNTSSLVIQGAVSAGVWTKADSQALMNQLINVSPEQRLALVEELYAAINRQELVMKDFPPL
jgi:hypothetical protein